MSDSEKRPTLSVVVPARNSADTIGECIRSLKMHIPSNVAEIIVVDNGSTDETGRIASEEGVHLVEAPDVFVSEVRNQGAWEATGELLGFIDSDCTISQGWYKAALELLDSDSAIAVAGSRHVIPDNPSWVEEVWFLAHHRKIQEEPVDVSYIPAGNLVVRADVFRQVKGFDPSMETGEDPDLCNRIRSAGYRIVEWDRILCVHLGEPKTLLQVFLRERWHGRGVRLQYADGRWSPVVLATAMFLLLIMAGAAGLAASGILGVEPSLMMFALALGIPAVFAAVKGRTVPPYRLPALALVYMFYFMGRAASLPGAIARAMFRKKGPRGDG
ncbi:MAG: glycosyltransferase [Acidobacteria bacterium]|uniref:Glycosyltransferase n=1 Tax=Candidatus Polarisedimenticola svalbardensis TaxID=2886004 RepID=A0A8J6XY16_9BACT|nr:glycosyltransferase [Candidatus Polarisedimenticola svalbardensis]